MSRSDPLCAPYFATGAPIDGVSVSTIGSPAGGETLASSDRVAARLDEVQIDLGVGPAWDAFHGTHPVSAEDLCSGEESRWPLFAEAVAGLMVCAVFAFPLAFAEISVGVVQLYAQRSGALPDAALRAITEQTRLTFFEVVARTMRDAALETSENPASRRVVHQATGMIVRRYRLSVDNAVALLHARSFSLGIPVADVADAIVHRRSPSLALTKPEEYS